MVHTKKVTKSGGISIPVDLRREYNIHPGDALDVEVNSKGQVQLIPHTPRCIFCSTVDEVSIYQGKGICRSCTEKIGGEFGDRT